MLYDNSPAALRSAKMEQCKPDYETQIKSAREQLAKHHELLDAIFKFNGNDLVRGKMAELVGELYSGTVAIKVRIDSLIADQEADQQ